MEKKMFVDLILQEIKKRIPQVRSSQQAEGEIIVFCKLLSEACLSFAEEKKAISKLNKFAEQLTNTDEQKTKECLLSTAKQVVFEP